MESPGLAATTPDSAPPVLPPPVAQALPQLKIKRLYMDVELQPLPRLALVADALAVEYPVVSLTYLGQGVMALTTSSRGLESLIRSLSTSLLDLRFITWRSAAAG